MEYKRDTNFLSVWNESTLLVSVKLCGFDIHNHLEYVHSWYCIIGPCTLKILAWSDKATTHYVYIANCTNYLDSLDLLAK